jgi:hypothetical protein
MQLKKKPPVPVEEESSSEEDECEGTSTHSYVGSVGGMSGGSYEIRSKPTHAQKEQSE